MVYCSYELCRSSSYTSTSAEAAKRIIIHFVEQNAARGDVRRKHAAKAAEAGNVADVGCSACCGADRDGDAAGAGPLCACAAAAACC